MGFLGVYTAIYDYQPQAEGELEIREGDLLYVLDKDSEDDWWKAKKKADRDDEDEPEGLVPNNYVEEAQPTHKARALYDYTRQTDEEVSFSEDAELVVYDTSDPDWTLVGVNSDFGFAPANYIEIVEGDNAVAAAVSPIAPASPAVPALPQRPVADEEEYQEEDEPAPPPQPARPVSTEDAAQQNPAAAAIANILHQQHASVSEPPPPPQPPRPAAYDEPDEHAEEEEPAPALPQRPPSSQIASPPPLQRQVSPPEPSPPPRPQYADLRDHEPERHVRESPPYNRVGQPSPRSPSGYHIYNINEMVEAMGKRKKMPTTLGINVATGTIFISPEGDGHQQEWTAEKLTHYSIEGKHVFLDLVRPSKSVDFHAGAKDTAQEIVSALGEIAGGYKAEGLREVIAAGTGGAGQKKGQVLYDFMAQGDDEVTVAVGDEVVILDDTKSDEWWMVRRIKNGKEGVVPSSYVEITGFVSAQPSGVDAGLSTVEKNRREESRLAKAMIGKARTDSIDSKDSERHSKRDSRSGKSKPDPSKTRQWTDRTKTFTVEAQFIGLHDGKIHLHKMNGVKIAVPIAKMSVEDLEYVERATGVSLDEDKPLSDVRRRSMRTDAERSRPRDGKPTGASVEQPKPPEYDWFDFFLKAGVGPHQCERYAQNFTRDWMDESVLPDITPETLRTLGLKEGDILRVMRYLDNMFNRTGSKSKLRNVSFGGAEVVEDGGAPGLFSGPGGALRNNTRKGRPTPTNPAGDVVDPKAFEQQDDTKAEKSSTAPSAAAAEKPVQKSFDDDAWEVKQPKSAAAVSSTASKTTPATSPASPPAPVQPQITGAMADLSLLQTPLQPTVAQPTSPAPPISPPILQPQPTAVPAQTQPLQPQQTGATPGFFAQVGQAVQPARQQPQAPQMTGQTSLLPPPPQRPLSAPQNFAQQQSAFGPPPLQPQLTGIRQNMPPLAPPGQSLGELTQHRFQQSLQPQATGFAGVPSPFSNGMVPQSTGFAQQTQQQQPSYLGIQQQQQQQQPSFQGFSPQQTGFAGFAQPQPQQPMQTGINSVLPPALQPQPTGMILQPQPTATPAGLNGFGGGGSSMSYRTSPPPIPQQQQQSLAPLQPQKTGPPPPVRFGVKKEPPVSKLAPQPTGLRANLAQATPTNPFGF